MRELFGVSEEERDEVRREAHCLVDEILEAFEDARMENFEAKFDRFTSAHYAVLRFWRLYDLIIRWAEDLHRGRYILDSNKEVRDRCTAYLEKHDIDEGFWMQQAIGQFFRGDRPVVPCLEGADLDDLLYSEGNRDFDPKETRYVIAEMLASALDETSWVERLRKAAILTNFGVKSSLFEPSAAKHGDAEVAFLTKSLACRFICFQVGAGSSKEQARVALGQQMGVSEHALKKWEGEVRIDGETQFLLAAAEFAGSNATELSKHESLMTVERDFASDEGMLDEYYGVTFIEAAYQEFLVFKDFHGASLRGLLRASRERRP